MSHARRGAASGSPASPNHGGAALHRDLHHRRRHRRHVHGRRPERWIERPVGQGRHDPSRPHGVLRALRRGACRPCRPRHRRAARPVLRRPAFQHRGHEYVAPAQRTQAGHHGDGGHRGGAHRRRGGRSLRRHRRTRHGRRALRVRDAVGRHPALAGRRGRSAGDGAPARRRRQGHRRQLRRRDRQPRPRVPRAPRGEQRIPPALSRLGAYLAGVRAQQRRRPASPEHRGA